MFMFFLSISPGDVWFYVGEAFLYKMEQFPQVEKYGQVPPGKHRNSLEQGGSIPVGKFSDFFLWLPVNFQQETGGKWSKVTGKNVASFRAEYRHPVPPTSGAFLQDMVDYPAFSCWFPQDPFSGSIDLGLYTWYCGPSASHIAISKTKARQSKSRSELSRHLITWRIVKF